MFFLYIFKSTLVDSELIIVQSDYSLTLSVKSEDGLQPPSRLALTSVQRLPRVYVRLWLFRVLVTL
jgi:hypothetical protein